MWKVTNKFKDVRKFRDGNLGKDILVNPGDSALTMTPPIANEVFDVEKIEKVEVKRTKRTKEMI